MFILHSPDPPEGGNSVETTEETPPLDPAPPARIPVSGEAAPPPAATVVVNGQITEREAELGETIRQRELRIMELEDENRQLRSIPKPPPPQPAKKKDFWETFFGQKD